MKYAEQCNYWKTSKTSKTSPDAWMEKIVGLIESNAGELLATGFDDECMSGRAAYIVRFKLEGQVFRITWPVLPSEFGDSLAARRQAVVMLWHDVKAKIIASQVLGAGIAFFCWAELQDGRSAYQVAPNELEAELPKMLARTGNPPYNVIFNPESGSNHDGLPSRHREDG